MVSDGKNDPDQPVEGYRLGAGGCNVGEMENDLTRNDGIERRRIMDRCRSQRTR